MRELVQKFVRRFQMPRTLPSTFRPVCRDTTATPRQYLKREAAPPKRGRLLRPPDAARDSSVSGSRVSDIVPWASPLGHLLTADGNFFG